MNHSSIGAITSDNTHIYVSGHISGASFTSDTGYAESTTGAPAIEKIEISSGRRLWFNAYSNTLGVHANALALSDSNLGVYIQNSITDQTPNKGAFPAVLLMIGKTMGGVNIAK